MAAFDATGVVGVLGADIRHGGSEQPQSWRGRGDRVEQLSKLLRSDDVAAEAVWGLFSDSLGMPSQSRSRIVLRDAFGPVLHQLGSAGKIWRPAQPSVADELAERRDARRVRRTARRRS